MGGDGCTAGCLSEAVLSLEITRADWGTRGRLRVVGNVQPFDSLVQLFAPGTATSGVCTATFVADVPTDLTSGDFLFRSGRGGIPTNPVTVCVSAGNGLAVSILVTVN